MPPGWAIKKTGERSDQRQAVLFFFLIVWVSRQTLAITLHRCYYLEIHFIRYVMRSRETGQSLTLSRLSYVSTVCLFVLPESGA